MHKVIERKNMSITLWILYSFVAVFSILYIVGFCKKINLLTALSSVPLLPLIGTANVLLLIDLLPDSFHTILLTIITYSLIFLSLTSAIFEKRKIFTHISIIFYILTILSWCSYYISAFYIYRVQTFVTVIFAIVYGTISIATCFFSGHQKLFTYLTVTLIICLTGVLNLFGFIFLYNTKTTSAILLYAGATINTALVIFYYLDKVRFNFKLGKPIKLLLLLAFQALISYSNFIILK